MVFYTWEIANYFPFLLLFIINKKHYLIVQMKLNEEITKAEVRSMIDSKVSDYLKDKEFEKRVREITTDAMEKFFRMMYNKRGFWKGELKNV